MRIGKLAAQAGVTVKTVRYYEQLGLIQAGRSANQYRDFDNTHVRAVAEIKSLVDAGIPASQADPFLECLDLGHEHGDECISSLAVYRNTIADLDRKIAFLTSRRDQLNDRLQRGAGRTFDSERPTVTDYTTLPEGLPVPEDDGAADHLAGQPMPAVALCDSSGKTVNLNDLGPGRTVIYLYPLTGQPGVDLPEGWDSIPGARGCSTEACDFRDHFEDLHAAGVDRVYGMSSQTVAYQAEVVDRLRLPFTMLSDESFALAGALGLPTFSVEGHPRLYTRLTLVVTADVIEHVFYPIFPPNTHAQQVLDWARQNPL